MSKFCRAESPPIARLAIALTALCMFLAVAASRADAAPWSGPETVSAPDAVASASEVGVDAGGDATAVWTEGGVAGPVIETAYRPAGAGWETPMNLSIPGDQVEDPHLAVNPAGDAIAVWRDTTGGNFAVEAAFKPAGGSWEPSEIASDLGSLAETPQVSIDEAGDAVVVWREGGGGILGSYRPAGGSWDQGVYIAPPGAEAPDVAMDAAGAAYVVWTAATGSESVVEANGMSPGGSWSAPQALSSPASVAGPAQVEADAAGDFFALWSRGASNSQVVEVDRRDASLGWQAPESISTAGLEAPEPQLAVDPAGDVVAAWNRNDGSVGSIEATSLKAGGLWAPPTRLSPSGVDAESPRIAISPAGVAQVVWTGTKEAEHHLEVSTVRLQVNASWKASITIAHEGRLVFAPRIGVDHSGHTVVTWSVETSVGVVVIKGSTHDERSALDVTKSGAGSGTVTSLPARIDCGSVCSGEFLEGVTVTLTATPAPGSRFAGWSGACSGTGTCAVEIGGSQAVDAEFAPTSSGGGETGGGEAGTSGGTTPNGDSGGSSSTGPAPSPQLEGAPACTVVSAPSVGTFVPTPHAGRAVLGVRVKVGVKVPSAVHVTGTLILGPGKAGRVGLGTASYDGSGSRNLRFPLPAGARSKLSLGTPVRLLLRVSTVPDSTTRCATPGVLRQRLKVRVVKVLAGRQAGVH